MSEPKLVSPTSSTQPKRVDWLWLGVPLAVMAVVLGVWADPFPPAWNNGSGAAVHFAPVAWPSEPDDPKKCAGSCGEWKPYTRFQGDINDPRVRDPSNGGTAPQNSSHSTQL